MRNVLVTGGARGIGHAIKDKFMTEGYRVFSPTREELNLLDDQSINQYIKSNQHIAFDVLINNAGINTLDYLENISDEDFDQMMQINLKAPYKIIQGFVGNMKEKKYGRIINLSSVWSIKSKEKRMLYSTVKSGINGMTRALAVELGSYNILVNSICPGFVNTELTKKNISVDQAEELCKSIPLMRFAEPEEIAEVVYFLSSEKNTYITGQKIVADGGFVIK